MIVAAAIFTVATWNLLDPIWKLAVMGGFTAAFFVAGDLVYRKLDLRFGGIALTTVAAAMLLFDGWIVIDGYNLTGPLPWAVLLLVVSAVYWWLELRLTGGFFGGVGAAAQVGWWWLLATQLDVPKPWAVAGIAVVALVWQIFGERSRGSDALAPLARTLLVAAPVVAAVSVVAEVIALVTVSDQVEGSLALAAIVTSVATGAIAMRPRRAWSGGYAGMLCQVPALVAVGFWSLNDLTWWTVLALSVLALGWALAALRFEAAPLVVPSLLGQVGIVVQACVLADVLVLPGADVPSAWLAAALWLLAVAWIALGARWQPNGPGARTQTRSVLTAGGWVLLGVTSLVVVAGSAETGLLPVSRVDIPMFWQVYLMQLGLAVAWLAAAWLQGGTLPAIGALAATLWATQALNAFQLLRWPPHQPLLAWRALVVLVAAAVWLLGRRWIARLLRADAVWLGVVAGIAVAASTLVAMDPYGAMASAGLWTTTTLVVSMAVGFVGAAVLAADVWVNREPAEFRPPEAAAAAVLAVLASALPGLALERSGLLALAPAAVAALIGLACLTLSGVVPRLVFAFASAAASILAGLLVLGPASIAMSGDLGYREAWLVVAATVALSVSLALTTVAVGFAPLIALTGLSLGAGTFIVLAIVDPAALYSILAVALTAGLLLVPSALGPTRRGGRLSQHGASLAVSGGVVLAALVIAGLPTASDVSWGVDGTPDRWYALGWSGVALALLVLGVYCITAGWLRKHAWPVVLGGGVLVLALWAALASLRVEWVEVYTVPLALYLALLAAVWARRPLTERAGIRALDVVTVVVLVAPSIVASLTTVDMQPSSMHALIAFGLALAAVAAGVLLHVRAYFFGGVAAVALIAVWRSLAYLSQLWWVVLGVVGIVLLVVALTWERQRLTLADSRQRLAATFRDWR